MSLENKKPLIVGFDGLHRTGKGTQAEMLHSAITLHGGRSVVLRGDGTREGLGLHDGDPYSAEWQARSKSVKSPEGNTIEAWNASAYLLVRELSERLEEDGDNYDALILDRTVISRAAFLLHRGVGIKGTRFALDDMYPDNEKLSSTVRIDLADSTPDIIFDIHARSPHEMLARLDPEDPKYLFRSRNIKGGYDSAIVAAHHLPVELENRVETLIATDPPEQVHTRVVSHLATTALSAFLPHVS
jgi:thymidylate kinase